MGMLSRAAVVRRTLGAGVALAAATLFLSVFCVERAEAIPALSREYKTECTTCHTIYPQLNEFGQAFEKNGFVWPGGVPLSKKVKAAETEEERKSREFIILSGIPKGIPVSFLGSISYLYNKDAEDNVDQKRYSLELLLGGAFGGDRIGFWSHQSLGNQNTTSSNSLSGPSDLYFVARHPFGVPVHLKAGKFAPDLSLWKTSLNGRMLSTGYSVDYSVTSAQNGLELSTIFGSRVQAVVGVNDRNNATGKDASGKDNPSNSVNEYYAHLAVKFGGADFHGKEPDIDLDKDSVWDYLSISIGAFGYSGSTSKGEGVNHDLTRFGLEGEVAYRKWLLMLGATLGENNAESDDPLKSTALSAEVNFVFNPMFALALRYDTLDVDARDKRNVITPGIIYAPLQNFKLRLSAAIDSNPTSAATGKADSNTTATLQASMSF